MGVRTDATEKLEEINEHIKRAIQLHADIVIGECYGSNEISAKFKTTLRETMNQLMEIREKLR
jgi:hypothetical protein